MFDFRQTLCATGFDYKYSVQARDRAMMTFATMATNILIVCVLLTLPQDIKNLYSVWPSLSGLAIFGLNIFLWIGFHRTIGGLTITKDEEAQSVFDSSSKWDSVTKILVRKSSYT